MSLPTGLTLFFAAILANLPFVSVRLFAFFQLPRRLIIKRRKPIYLLALECLCAYCLTGAVARILEAHAGEVMHQGWEFYVVTACAFSVLAFPGFVFRYLLKF